MYHINNLFYIVILPPVCIAEGDKLTNYNGTALTYDKIGNPLTYYNGQTYTFTWTGRQLTGATYGGKTMSFTYNDNGIRTSKTVAGVTTTYYLDGDLIVAEETNGNVTVYIYDENNLPIGMQYHGASYAEDTWDVYWFEKNLFGDVILVRSNTGTALISYAYNAYGECTVNYLNSGGSTTATLNPFRYRSYYFDKDLNLYYVNSRYYDAKLCRWISPDAVEVIASTPMSLSDNNLYACCDNNPVTRVDYGGEFWNVIAGAIIGAAVNFVGAVITEVAELIINEDDEFDWGDVGISTGIGAVEGAAIALMPGAAIPISATASALDTMIDGIRDGDGTGEIVINTLMAGAIGAAGGAGGVDFAKGGKLINDAAGSIGNAIRKGVHPTVKKTARKAIGKAVKHIGKSFGSGLAEDFAYGGIYEFGSWFTNTVIDRAFGR